jgi:hypothetical protein
MDVKDVNEASSSFNGNLLSKTEAPIMREEIEAVGAFAAPVRQLGKDLIMQLYKKKCRFSVPELDINAWFKSLLTHPDIREEHMGLLENQARRGSEQAQEKLYNLLIKPVGNIDLRDNPKARQILELGLQENF